MRVFANGSRRHVSGIVATAPVILRAARQKRGSRFAVATGLIVALVGLPIAYGGGVLVGLGGSAYYALAGLALIASGVLLVLQRPAGAWLYAVLYVATWVWALAEAGLEFWPLAPRVIAPTVLAIPVMLSLAFLARIGTREPSPDAVPAGHEPPPRAVALGYGGAAAMAVGLIAFGVASTYPHDAVYGRAGQSHGSHSADGDRRDWTAYGRTNAGRRFAPFAQIDRSNVRRLEVAWIARTGNPPDANGSDEATPLQIRDKLITCTPQNIVNAFDVDSGDRLWRFDPDARGLRQRCRGVSYFAAETDTRPGERDCAERIVMTTIDSRLIELDLETGRPCAGFGDGGTVDLAAGLGDVPLELYFQTSAPLVAGGVIVVGGLVADGVGVHVPSGVVRAFDARTGELRWAWDVGATAGTGELTISGRPFTPGTPNVWAPMSADEDLGLAYLPTGNASPDHWGGNRTPAMEKYGSSIVALELGSGKVRWTFQTTHHDLWDYDVSSQPTLVDQPDGRGGFVPLLIAPTKRGEIFVLDRRTGVPVRPVEERPAPRGVLSDDPAAPTQPYSVEMPTVSVPRLTEADMWGLSPLDQLWCRITFRKLRYRGDFTPPGLDSPILMIPGSVGGFNWGSGAVDETGNLFVINDTRLGDMLTLASRADVDREGKGLQDRLPRRETSPIHGGMFAQAGTPYAAVRAKFMSPLDVPCHEPPYGTMSAIDLRSGRLAWQVPLGTSRDTGPLGTSTAVPMAVGMPTTAGPLVTGGGLVFFAGTQDYYLRALDVATGRELWKGRLPVGSSASPMTYISPRSGRQFVVVPAGGAASSPAKGDYLIAYALPLAQ